MSLNRRDFLKSSSLSLAALSMPKLVFGANPNNSNRDVLVVVFQRGGMDGLNAVVPYGDADYYRLRPTIGLPRPGQGTGAVLDLDGFFGFHPSLAPLLPIYQAGQLAVVQATGFKHESRSHFECQDRIERATMATRSVTTGWLNRHLSVIGGDASFQSVAVGNALPGSLRGPAPVIGLRSIGDFTLQTQSKRKALLEAQLQRLYDTNDLLAATGTQALGSIDELSQANPLQYPVEHGATYPNTTFGSQMQQIAQLIKAGVGLEVASADIGGWDHHNNEAPQMNTLLGELANTLAAFHTDLGAVNMANVTVLTMTEFGRRAYQNASSGTDHGSAFCTIAMGGGVLGGQVYRAWPGLSDARLYNGDLDITIDYRDVLAEALSKRHGNSNLSSVFPDYTIGSPVGIFRPRGG
ncbi:hypothetical protein C7S18_16775 [Ahniella affigens]|uniref:DUF1501 domain-containing protein n=1 Tax=Ahniella affigens TaxID=2021234 RepID=A0A2P1PV89_9GAMM|nr:DUF1501 domain-containing protein [Ahniella affigens]AVP98740.1 hypothetical protein C7S18_16775 [Ahniella affigens]